MVTEKSAITETDIVSYSYPYLLKAGDVLNPGTRMSSLLTELWEQNPAPAFLIKKYPENNNVNQKVLMAHVKLFNHETDQIIRQHKF